MKKILVPTDFSACANNAANFAIQTAKYLPVKVVLLHAFETSESPYARYVGLDLEYTNLLKKDLRSMLNTLANNIKNTDGVEVETILTDKSLSESISTVCEAQEIDLIVMGTLGATGLREKLWGSKTASQIDKTTAPLMVIPHNYSWKKPERFLFATNHFEENEIILNYLFEMASMYQANLEITSFTDEDSPEAIQQLQNKLDGYCDKLKPVYDNALTNTVLHGDRFDETLQHYITKDDVDILTMVTYHKDKSFFYRLFNASATTKMSYHTETPLLVIPGGGH